MTVKITRTLLPERLAGSGSNQTAATSLTAADLPQQLAGLLGGPGSGGMGSDAQDVHPAGAGLHDDSAYRRVNAIVSR